MRTTFAEDYMNPKKWVIFVEDEDEPELGVAIFVDDFGEVGPTNFGTDAVDPAEVSVCSNSMKIFMDSIDSQDDVTVTCGSATIQIFVGPVEVEFNGDNGEVGSATLVAGDELTFEPETMRMK